LIRVWSFGPPFFDLDATARRRILLIVAGLPWLVDSFAALALQGLGTPEPIAADAEHSGAGLYRSRAQAYLRALLAAVMSGQVGSFRDHRLLLYGVFVGSPSTRCHGVRGRRSF